MEKHFYSALAALENQNQMLHDYWCSVLFDCSDKPIPGAFNHANLRLIETDVMEAKITDCCNPA